MVKSFADFGKIAVKIFNNNSHIYHQNMAAIVGGELAFLNPIDSGLSTGNWNIAAGSPDLTPRHRFDNSISATPTKKRLIKESKSNSPKQDLYISNAVQSQEDGNELGTTKPFTGEGYINQLNEGSSRKAPLGMTGPTLARAHVLSKKALKGKL